MDNIKKILFTLIIVTFSTVVYGQEICDNGIDDDGDGLVDLNDNDCQCAGIPIPNPVSLVPNHSFEDRTCCPSKDSEFHCVNDLNRGTNGSIDYFNTCGGYRNRGGQTAAQLPLPGGGNGWVGIFNFPTNKEYMGVDLRRPLKAGVTYKLHLWMAHGRGNNVLDLTIFGWEDLGECGSPFPNRIRVENCPTISSRFKEVANKPITFPTPGVWLSDTLTFTPTFDMSYIAIGGSCNPTTNMSDYFYLDDVVIVNSVPLNKSLSVFDCGNLCRGDLELKSTIDTFGGSWQWYKDGVALVGETDSVVEVSANGYGVGIYKARYELSGICDTASISVELSITDNVDLGSDTILCQGELLALDARTPGATYSWQDNSTNATLDVVTTGSYSVDVMLGACTTSDTIDVSFIPRPMVDLDGDKSFCSGDTLVLDADTPDVTYFWSDSLSTDSTFNVTQPGDYWVVVTALNGCTASDTVNVNSRSPSVYLGEDTTLCEGQILSLDADTAGGTYLWQDNSTLPTFDIAITGSYWVTVTTNGCSTSDTIDVNFDPPPTVNLGDDTTLCEGEVLKFDVTALNVTYLWVDNSTNATLDVTLTGSYWVELTSLNECKASDTVDVNFNPLPSLDAGGDIIVNLSESATLNATGSAGSYNWTPPTWLDCPTCLATSTTPKETITYEITITDSNGCVSSDDVTVVVETQMAVFVPNIFSPNGDGNNDILYVRGVEVRSINFIVYSRWGEKVFSSESLDIGWDGSFRGKPLNSGVFKYYLTGAFDDGTKIQQKGDITLVR